MSAEKSHFRSRGFQNFTSEKPKREEKITVSQATLLFNDAEEFDSTK